VGFALDKYGDVYSVASDLSGLFRDPVWERFQDLRAYVRSVPADEVERLMADAELASHAGDLHRTFGEDEAHCEAAYDSGRGFRTVALDETKGAPSARARAWLHAVLRE
jgi:cytochrome c556